MSKEQFGSPIEGSKMIAERIERQNAKVHPHVVIEVLHDLARPIRAAARRVFGRRFKCG